jgi:opacity protein-like surface antigen
MPYAPQATMFAEYEQSLSEADKKVAALGGDYLLPGRGKLYVRHEFISSLSSPFALNPAQRNNVTVFGLDTDYAKDKHVFTEYRMRDAIDGRTAEAALGLRSGYQIAEGLKLTTSSERVHTLSGPIANESQAYTVGLEYTANPRLKASTRIEWRQSTQANSILGSVGVAYKLSDDWTTLARGVHSVIENKGAAIGERIQTRLQAGLAYRDSATDVWNALGRVEYRNEEDTTQPDTPLRRELALGSLHFNYQPAKSTLINGRVATKFVTENSLGLLSRSQTQLLSGRVTVDLNHDWDVGAQASILASRGFSDRQFGVGVEAGYQVADNLWLSAGYNVFGFKEKDLTSDPMDRGFFVRLRFKFDEDVFKPAKEKRPSVYATSKQSRPATVASPQLLIDPAEGLANETKGLQTSSRLQSVEYMTANETRLDYRISEPAVTRWLALVGYVSSVPGGGIIQQEVVMGPGSDEPQYTCVLDAPLHVFAVTDSLSRELTRATASGGSVSAPDGGAGK